MRVHVYIDGFSLYHLCYRGERNLGNQIFKWLDVRALSQALFPHDDILLVRYSTARVGDSEDDPRRASRQDVFIRALRALPSVEVIEGQFQWNRREGRLVHPPAGVDRRQTVYLRQEKRSDVSLAAHLLVDAFNDRYDMAVLVTNDSDFVEPIQVVRGQFNKRVAVISPDERVGK